jgi:hypothetical protein
MFHHLGHHDHMVGPEVRPPMPSILSIVKIELIVTPAGQIRIRL